MERIRHLRAPSALSWRLYAATRIPETPTAWSALHPVTRRRAVWGLWCITELLLIAGLFDRRAYDLVVAFSALHALLALGLLGFRPLVFPAQLRIAYLLWVAVGAWVPSMTVLMHITTVGIFTNLVWGYCPLARMLYLLPFNRDHALTPKRAWRVLVQPPRAGRFSVD